MRDGKAVPVNQPWRCTNDPAGLGEWVQVLGAVAPAVGGLDATGGLDLPVASALGIAGVAVTMIHPRPARDFANAVGRLANPDRLDADRLARFGPTRRPAGRPLKAAAAQPRSALLARRGPWVARLTAEKTRFGTANPGGHNDLQAHLHWREKRFKPLDKALDPGGVTRLGGRLRKTSGAVARGSVQ